MRAIAAAFCLGLLIAFPGYAAAIQKGTQAWPRGEVPYRIDADLLRKAGATSDNCRGWQRWRPQSQGFKACKAMDAWHVATGVRFVADWKRIDVLRIQDGRNGTSATLGHLLIGNQMQVEEGASYGAVLHEFGHVLGLMHEHQRQDRDAYIRFEAFLRNDLAHCGLKFNAVCSDVRTAFLPVEVQMSMAYDPCSLMHYLADQTPRHREDPRWRHIFSPTTQGEMAMKACRGQFASLPERCDKVGQKCVISHDDAALIRRFYN